MRVAGRRSLEEGGSLPLVIRLTGAIAFLAAVLPSGTTLAFSPHGHETVESTAYRRLVATAEGRETLAFLIGRGLLDVPPAEFDPPKLPGFPSLRTGQADSVLARQAGTLGQCFHFMAEADDANHELAELTRPDGTIETIHPNTADVAYGRCVNELAWLLGDAIADPQTARQSFRGLYATMHAITDSYSSAHVERLGAEGTGAILHLRPWRLLTFQKIPIHRGVGKLYFDSVAYHKISDPRDESYLADGRDLPEEQRQPAPPGVSMPANCRDYREIDPNFVPEGCLSAAALRASDALVALLRLTHDLVAGMPSAPCPPQEPGGRDERCRREISKYVSSHAEWQAFVKEYLAFQPSTITPIHPMEVAVTFLFGATVEYRPNNAYVALHIQRVDQNQDPLNPPLLLTFPFFDLGARRYQSQSSFTVRDGIDLILPLSGRLSIGFSPFSLLLSFAHPWEFSLNSQLGFLDFYLAPLRTWIRLSGPDWNIAQFVRPDSLAAMSAVGLHQFAAVTIGGHREGISDRQQKLIDKPPGDWSGWSPKPRVHEMDTTNIVSATVNKDHDQVLAGLGVESLDTRDALGRLKPFTWGIGVGISLLQAEKNGVINRYGVLTINPGIMRIESHVLFADLIPVAEGGYGNGWHGDLGGAARLGIQVVERLQIRVRSPRWSLADHGRFNGEILGIELGFRCWEGSRICF